ncbi:uncharacterized protein LOC125468333 [Pyrus x bretschneideri]|uniref:uncharacterized protein LOC125468333 n=1 Tax=Pyrus x bretschneideri TaxID=225117 RepID=UPI00202EADDF|nr:uncharacterized protein LOC125468333 [Pyrus x bretschneideri]XP_048419933.1 uncharacterized protein LOC125468333 [Pyrus x bretschneideri]
MRARVIVFPVRGRNWCFSRSVEPLVSDSASSPPSQTPSTLKDLWKKYNSNANDKAIANPLAVNAELLVDFVSTKMNIAWIGLEKSPRGSFKNKIHGLGLKLLSRVKPSEIFLKSISNEVTGVEVKYPSSLNARLVRRRLRYIAMRGSIIHRKYLYGSVTLLPLTSACAVLPLPNIPFFWCLFRTYSHWRALKGSERLLKLVSDSSVAPSSTTDGNKNEHIDSQHGSKERFNSPYVLQPSTELEELLCHGGEREGLKECAILDICKIYDLNTNDVLKYRDSM